MNASAGAQEGKSNWRKLVDVLSQLVIILGIPAFLWQEYRSNEIRKSERTLDYIKLFQDDRLSSARSNLLGVWTEYSGDISASNMAGGMSPQVRDHLVQTLIARTIDGKKDDTLRKAVFAVVEFYDQLSICITSNACDGRYAKLYFDDESHRFFCLYGGWVQKTGGDLGMKSFGAGLRVLATSNSRQCT